MVVFRKLWAFVKVYKWQLYLGIFFTIMNVVTSMIPGEITQRIVDDVIRSGNTAILLVLLAALTVTSLFRAGSIFLERLFMESVSQGVFNDLKQAFYEHLQKLSFNFFNKNRTGELMSRMTGDMEAIRQLFADGVVNLVKILFYLFFTSAVLMNINLKLTLITMMASPFVAFFTLRFSQRIKPISKRIREQFSRLNTTVQENITGIRIVKAFHQHDFEMQKFNHENNEFFKNNFKAAEVWATYFPILEFLSGLCTVLLLFFGGRMVISGEIQLGEWIQFNSYLWMFLLPMRLLGHMVDLVNRAVVSGERIFAILEEVPEIDNVEKALVHDEIRGEVEFRNVSLKFGNETVLDNISLKVKAGETIAIMGVTGSGKSSLVNLIGRFYEPTEGEVLIDNIHVKNIDLKFLRSNIAYVMQDVLLFSETIYENITYGIPNADMTDVAWAAEIARARDFIEDMDEKYDTIVGEMGMGLSGGQKQRVSLARALIKKAPILILDDATSAVDLETEQFIYDSIQRIEKKSTIFIITHRISSVKKADQIIILKNGRIIEKGTHEELLAIKGEYYNIYIEQFKDILEEQYMQEKQVMS